MGFGILFAGYAIAFLASITYYGYVFRLVGFCVMAVGLLRLREYGKGFRYPLILSLIMTVYGIFESYYELASKFGFSLPSFAESLRPVMNWVTMLGIIIFNFALLYAIFDIANRLELTNQKNAALRNAVFLVFYLILNVLGMGPFNGNETFGKYFALPIFLIQLLWVIFNLVLIFSCYMYICPEGDEDMPRRKTGIGVIDRLAEESDRRADKAVRDTQEYIKQKHAEKQNKKSKKK